MDSNDILILSWEEDGIIHSTWGTLIDTAPHRIELKGLRIPGKGRRIAVRDTSDSTRAISSFYRGNQYVGNVLEVKESCIVVNFFEPDSVDRTEELGGPVQRRIGAAHDFMQHYNQSLLKGLLSHKFEGLIITSLQDVIHTESVEIVPESSSYFKFEIRSDTITAQHLKYNTAFRVMVSKEHVYQIACKLISVTQVGEKSIVSGRIVKFSYGRQSIFDSLIVERKTTLSELYYTLKSTLAYWLEVTRIKLFLIPLIPFLMVISLVLGMNDTVSVLPAILIVVALICVQSGASLLNDYFDFTSKTDEITLQSSPLSGGSQFIQKGLIKPEHSLFAGLMLLILTAVIGLILVTISGSIFLLVFGLSGMLLSYFYSASPIELVRRGLGEITLGLIFGPMVMIGSYFVIVKEYPTSDVFFLESFISMILIIALALLNNFQDFDVDDITGKRTIVVIVGRSHARYLVMTLIFLPYLLIGTWIWITAIPSLYLLSFLSLPLAVVIAWQVNSSYTKPKDLLRTNYGLVSLYLLLGLTLSLINLNLL